MQAIIPASGQFHACLSGSAQGLPAACYLASIAYRQFVDWPVTAKRAVFVWSSLKKSPPAVRKKPAIVQDVRPNALPHILARGYAKVPQSPHPPRLGA